MNLLMLGAFFSLMMSVGALGYYAYDHFMRRRWLKEIFDIRQTDIFDEGLSQFEKMLQLKLLRSGLTKKQLLEVGLAGIIGGAALISLIFILSLSMLSNLIIAFLAIAIALGTAPLYLEEQISARIKRIEEDLSIFIDLLIIILEGGGGLNNAIDYVTREGETVIRHDLLDEFRLFKYEFATFGSENAYTNLAKRTGSESIAAMVGFMKLSEETGIGVKSVFENQSMEIKEQEMNGIEKKAAMMNIYLTLIMFVFILPAMIAMIAFPIASDSLMSKF